MHPKLTAFIEEFEREAKKKQVYRNKIGRGELLFLEQVWGPAFQYDFSGLSVEYPFKDSKGGHRFADFVFVKNGIRILIEIDDFTTHARNISPGDFDDHLFRQNELMLAGWIILRFTYHHVQNNPVYCQNTIKQAIGHWWTSMYANPSEANLDIWTIRKSVIGKHAALTGGYVRPTDLVQLFQISSHTASIWLKRFAEEKFVFPMQPLGKRVRKYRLASCEG